MPFPGTDLVIGPDSVSLWTSSNELSRLLKSRVKKKNYDTISRDKHLLTFGNKTRKHMTSVCTFR